MIVLYVLLIIYFYIHLAFFLINLYDICAQPVSEKFRKVFRYAATFDEALVTTVTFFLIIAVKHSL